MLLKLPQIFSSKMLNLQVIFVFRLLMPTFREHYSSLYQSEKQPDTQIDVHLCIIKLRKWKR